MPPRTLCGQKAAAPRVLFCRDSEVFETYILEGSVILEVQGKPPATLKTGEAFTTAAGQVHNVKNASATAPAKALAFYIAKKGCSAKQAQHNATANMIPSNK